MIKLTPYSVTMDTGVQGTGRVNKQEVFPATPYLLNLIGIPVPEAFYKPTKLELTEAFKKRHSRLRPYQLEDVRLLGNRAVGLILSDPRTGKTPTAISVFKEKNVKKYLVLCPASITYQWKEEIEQWQGIKAEIAQGTKKKRLEMYQDWTEGALIMGYELFRIDQDAILEHKDIEGIILDEAHKIKNHKSQIFTAVRRLNKIQHKLLLSGTLAPNKSHEIFATLNFAFPGIFTGYYRFLDYFFITETQKNWATQIEYQVIGDLKNKTELPQFLSRVAVQHKQIEVMPWLPDKDYVKIKLDLNKKQAKYIEEMEEFFETEHVIVENQLTQILRIRQICQAPELLELDGKSPKIEWIEQFIKDFPEKQIIIFSNFTSFLKLLSEKLKIPNLIVGETPAGKRNLLKNLFQEGKIKVLLVNIKAGKEGLTLDNAEVSIFCDVFPPASDITQAENRMTATTEARKDKENTIYKLMMKDTYDEYTYDLVEKNIDDIKIINSYKDYLGGRK